jgi:hypothetical protein
VCTGMKAGDHDDVRFCPRGEPHIFWPPYFSTSRRGTPVPLSDVGVFFLRKDSLTFDELLNRLVQFRLDRRQLGRLCARRRWKKLHCVGADQPPRHRCACGQAWKKERLNAAMELLSDPAMMALAVKEEQKSALSRLACEMYSSTRVRTRTYCNIAILIHVYPFGSHAARILALFQTAELPVRLSNS